MIVNWQPGITLSELNQQIIEYAYRFFDKNKTKTAQALGISVRTLDKKLGHAPSPEGNEEAPCPSESQS